MLVVDASVAFKWFMAEDGSEQAGALLATTELLVAPDLIVAEVCNATWKAVRAGTMRPEQQDHAASRLSVAFDTLVPAAALAPRAVAISRALDHPVYDCIYLALAEARDIFLMTADRRLLERVKRTEWEGRVVDLRIFSETPTPTPAAR